MKQVNVQRLEVKKDKDYAEVLMFGDLHYGSPFCDIERAEKMLDYCYDNGIYVFCMGDLLEAATRYSIGSGVYEQLNPNMQIEKIEAMLGDLAKKGLILGYLSGNHEERIMKETGVDISKIICRELNIPYLGAAGWNLWYVGNQSYSVYCIHGATGSKFSYTKLKAITDISHYFSADLIAHAHTHDILINSIERQTLDKQNKTIKTAKSFLVVTGHYLTYQGSYAQAKGYPPGKQGSPKVKFFSDKKDIHISV